jgi:hypothetical protein
LLVFLCQCESFQSAGASAHNKSAFLVAGKAIDIKAAIFVLGPAAAGQFLERANRDHK